MGATRLGKTEWARSLGPHIFFTTMVDLNLWNSNVEYLICDDMEWKFLPMWVKQQAWGGQRQLTMTDKYKGKKTEENWSKPLIYLCNPHNDPREGEGWSIWHETNCLFFYLRHKLYNEIISID